MSSPTPRRPVAPPAPAPTMLPQTNLGNLPLKPAQVYISDDTSQQLQAIGWKPGDDVPEGLPEAVEIVNRKFAGEKATADAEMAALAGTTRMKVPDPVDIRKLPPAAIAELSQFMAMAKDWQKQQTEQANIRPELLQGINNAQQAANAGPRPKTEFLVDTAPPQVTQSAPPVFEQAATTPPPQPTPPVSETGTTSERHECERCGWDNRVPFNIEATDEDIRTFCVAVLSGQRFHKQIGLFGNRLLVTFRTLTAKESQLIFTQLRYDAENGAVKTDVEYLARMAVYRLMLGTKSIVRADNSVMLEIDELDKIGYVKPPVGSKQTELVEMYEWFTGESEAKHEDLFRILGREHERFQRLQELLEARTADPNFWNGIG